MNNKLLKTILAGVIATGVMTAIMFIAPMMGMPKMNPAAMLSLTMGMPLAIGWMMHFMMGIGFALSYDLIFSKLLERISNIKLRGAIFGFIAFIIAQFGMAMMGMVFNMPPMAGSMILIMMGSILGHVAFGVVVGLISDTKTESVALGQA